MEQESRELREDAAAGPEPGGDSPPATGPERPQPSRTGAQPEGSDADQLGGFTLSTDWLACTVPGSTVETVKELIGGEWIEAEKGFNGYPRAWVNVSTCGGSGRIGTGMRNRTQEIHASLSGEIVSAWSPDKMQAVRRWIEAQKGHCTRTDLALDDRSGCATVAQVIAAADAGNAVMRWSTYDAKRRCSYKGKDDVHGEIITFGSRQSESYLRVYDKRIEEVAKRREVSGTWVRWELELKKERADICNLVLAHLPIEEWRTFAVGLLKSCISFRDTTADDPSWIRCRAEELAWWRALTDGFARCRLINPKKDRKLEEVKQWFSQAMGPTIAALNCAAGREWIDQVIRAGADRWKPKHHQLMQKGKHDRQYTLKPP
jgi:phage replication initiation protein